MSKKDGNDQAPKESVQTARFALTPSDVTLILFALNTVMQESVREAVRFEGMVENTKNADKRFTAMWMDAVNDYRQKVDHIQALCDRILGYVDDALHPERNETVN